MTLGAYIRDADDAGFLLRRCVHSPGAINAVVFLANIIIVRFQTRKSKPNSFCMQDMGVLV